MHHYSIRSKLDFIGIGSVSTLGEFLKVREMLSEKIDFEIFALELLKRSQ